MDTTNEQILNLWLDVASLINNQRLVSYLSFNEANICNRLWRKRNDTQHYLTQNELCAETGMEKGLMNRTLHSLEEKGIIERSRSTVDKRTVEVKLKEDNDIYLEKVHRKSLAIVNELIQYWGEANTQKIVESLQLISAAAKNIAAKNR